MAEGMEKEWSLPEGFFEKNPLSALLTAGAMQYFQMQILFDDEVRNLMDEQVTANFGEKRTAEYKEERAAIEALSDPEETVRFMKKSIDPVNRTALVRKAVGMGDEAAELITKRLQRSGIDVFIETAMLVLSRADEKYIDSVAENFRRYSNGYARASATVLLAYRERRDALESIYREYCDFRRREDEESRMSAQTVLFSICVLMKWEGAVKADFDSLTGDSSKRNRKR